MRVGWSRPALFLLTVLFACDLCFGQSNGRPCAVPLVVTRFDPATRTSRMVEGLVASNLNLTIDGKAVPVGSLSTDSGPKRVVLVLDASRNVRGVEWNLATETAATLVQNARQDDRFALILTGRETAPPPFQSPGEIQSQLNELRRNRPSTPNGSERNYDALKAAASSLNPPRFGDAIFLFGHPEDEGSTATFDQIKQAILEGGIRFYGLSFTDPLKGALHVGPNPNQPVLHGVARAKLDELSALTGYFFSYHPPEALAVAGQKQLLAGFLADVYAGIAAPYRVPIPSTFISRPGYLEAEVSEDVHTRDVHYPHVVYPCVISP